MNTADVVFCGDFAPCRNFESVVLDKKERVLGDALPLIKSADMSFVNLECPLTNHNQQINKSGPALKANIQCVEALRSFSVVGLANNHCLDYGIKGLEDTISACHEVGLPTVGAGLDINQAQQAYIQEVKGVRIAIIAVAEYEFNQSEGGGAGSASIDPIENYQQIKKAKAEADVVIVTLHGGNEYFPYPRPGLRKLCQHYIELGAEAVICHHPHVPGAYEYYNEKPIIYSLGNFLFDNPNPPEDWDLGYMVHLEVDVEKKQVATLQLIPYRQSVELGGVRLLQGNEKEALLERIESYRMKLEGNHEWKKEWNELVERSSISYILRHFFPVSFRGLGLIARNTPLPKFLFNKKNRLHKINMLRCQSHQELLVAVLASKSQPRND